MKVILRALKSLSETSKLFGKPKCSVIGGQLLSVACISIGHFLDGAVLAYTSTAIPSMTNTTDFDFQHLPLVRSFHSLGATLACLFAGLAMNTLGRRGSTLLLTIPAYFIGFILIGFAQNIMMVIAGRFLTGIGLGLTLCIPTVYIVEISSTERRSVLGVLPNLFCQVGILSTYVAGHWLDWNWLAFACSVVCVPFAFGVWIIPESPLFLLERNKNKEAENSLRFLCRKICDEDLTTVKNKNEEKKRLKDVLCNRANLKPFFCGITLMGFFQATGYPILIGTTVDFFRLADKNISSDVASIVIGVVIVLFAVTSILTSKRFNPKVMLIVSSVGVSVCLFAFGVFCFFKHTETLKQFSWIPLANFIVFVGFFMSGYGSVSWLIFAEILPPDIRSSAYPIGISFTWLVNFLLTLAFHSMILDIGYYGTFWFYASISSIGVIFITICLPNTKNKTSQQIAEFYK